jgi:hypothetical protein
MNVGGFLREASVTPFFAKNGEKKVYDFIFVEHSGMAWRGRRENALTLK